MGGFWRDVRHGFRQLGRQPVFAAAAVGSLALGIGLNTTLFSVVNAVLLRDTRLESPERLVEIYTGISRDFPQLVTSYPDYRDIRQGADTLAGVAAHSYVRAILSTGPRGELVTGESVSANYFDVLGVRPRLGRAFLLTEDGVPDASPVVVLSHGLWQRRFGGDPSVLGQQVRLSGHSYTVVGVAPGGFTGTLPGIPTEFWVPVTMIERLSFSGVQMTADQDPGTSRLTRRGTRWLFIKARLAAGRTLEEARSEVEAIVARLRTTYPETNKDVTVSLIPVTTIRFHPLLDGYLQAAAAALLAAVGLVLLIACANVANMMLARGAARQRELAIRTAVGASRGRLIRQLLAESMVLSILGGAIGVATAWWAGRVLSGLGTDVFPMPIAFEFSIDRPVLLFATLVSLGSAVLFGLAPAWTASTPDLVPALKDAASTAAGGRARVTARDLLVVGQLAVSLVLLVAGALLGRALLSARGTDLGFDPTKIASLSFNLQMNGYSTDQATALRDRAIEALRALPGVESVSTTSRLPLAPDIMIDTVKVPGHHQADDDGTVVDTVAVGADYFDVVGVPIVEGRAFTDDDLTQQRRVAVINQTLARQFWPDGAIGRVLYTGGFTSPPLQIIGVARDHKVRSVAESPRPYLHVPAGPSRAVGLAVRTTAPARASLGMLRDAIWKLEPAVVFTEDVSAADVADTTMAPTRIGATALAAFGGLALVLASIGVYGVIAYSVSQRRREVGIRMALGAERRQVLLMVLRQGGRLAAAGVALGLVLSVGVGQLLESLLFGVSRVDPLAYAAAGGVLLSAAALANLIPAVAAARTDPMRALRRD